METIRVASISNQIVCHDWPEGKPLNTYKPPTNTNGPVNTISWARNTPWVVYVSKQGPTEIVSMEDVSRSLVNIHAVPHPSCACFQTSTKRSIAIGTSLGKLVVFDVKTKKIKKNFPQGPSNLFKVQYGLKDNHLFAAYDNGEILVYNNNSVKLSCSFKVPNSKTLTNFRCHPSKRNVLVGSSEEGIVAVWDINTSKTIMCASNHFLPVSDVAFSDQKLGLLACTGVDRRISIIDMNSGKLVLDLSVGRVPSAIEFCPDGNGYAVGFLDGKLLTYDIRNMSETVNQFSGHRTRINQIAFQKITKDIENNIQLPMDMEQTVEPNKSPGCESFSNMLNSDIVANILEGDNEPKNMSVCDSFIVAMGFDIDGASYTSLGITDSVKKLMDPEVTPLKTSPSMPNMHLRNEALLPIEHKETKQHKCVSEVFKTQSSTPAHGATEMQTEGLSPIVRQTDRNDLRQMMKEVVKEVIKEEIGDIREVIKGELEEFKKYIDYQNYLVSGSMRRQFLDLQMSIVKESIKFEDNLNRLREDLSLVSNGIQNQSVNNTT